MQPVVVTGSLLLLSSCAPTEQSDSESQAEAGIEESAAIIRDDASEALAAAFQEGAASLASGDFGAATEAFERALTVNPGDEISTYLAAAAASLSGDSDRALDGLEQLAALGSDLIPRAQTFAALEGMPGFDEAIEAIHTNARRCDASQVAFTLPEKDLFPEGIAYDPIDDAFYLGSLYKTKVVRVRRGESEFEVEDFVSQGQDGLYSVLGLAVDAERRLLWLATAADPPYLGFDEADRGKTALYAYDLATGELRHRFAIEDTDQPHLFNDLTISTAGEVYTTDSATGEIYFVAPSVGELEVLLPAGTFPQANGITLSDDDSQLFVASWAEGLSVVELSTNEHVRLAHPVGVSTNGPDGIYFHDNTLIAVFNAIGSGRLVRFWLDESRTMITRSEFLECNHPLFAQPTTGAIAPDGFYFIANSQFASFDENLQPHPLDELEEITVLRVGL